MSILGKLFPETLFPRKLSTEAEQRLRLAHARAEEALIRTHIENALHFVETLAPEVRFERALEIYIRELNIADPLASIVATRALVALGDSLIPAHPETESDAGAVPLPRLRLDDVDDSKRKRA
ncbi:MAG: hypothetical protein ABJB66_18685 [Gemmatimonadaceae bacterium]